MPSTTAGDEQTKAVSAVLQSALRLATLADDRTFSYGLTPSCGLSKRNCAQSVLTVNSRCALSPLVRPIPVIQCSPGSASAGTSMLCQRNAPLLFAVTANLSVVSK